MVLMDGRVIGVAAAAAAAAAAAGVAYYAKIRVKQSEEALEDTIRDKEAQLKHYRRPQVRIRPH